MPDARHYSFLQNPALKSWIFFGNYFRPIRFVNLRPKSVATEIGLKLSSLKSGLFRMSILGLAFDTMGFSLALPAP